MNNINFEKRKKNQKTKTAQEKQSRNFKDSLFVDLFAKCPEAKENFLSLYNAIHGTELKIEETKIEPMTLENTIYIGRYNDVSMLIDNKIIVLAEQQSTINENMPLRFLEYVARLYEKLIPLDERYRHRLVPLPSPEFYVFYNGSANYPAENILRLSDAFEPPAEKHKASEKSKCRNSLLELRVKVYNISIENEIPLAKQCKPLSGYSRLVYYARKAKADGRNDYLDFAVRKCIEEGILADYLKQNSTEVRNMLIAEYDYDTDIRVQRKESYEEGIAHQKAKDEKLLAEKETENARLADEIQVLKAQIAELSRNMNP